MEIRFKEIVLLSLRKCYRVVCNHPFLVGILCFLIFLYKSCPFLFFLLFHASPVLVCTAVLLGTLLSFGPSSAHEIDYVERVSDEITPLKAGVFGNASVIVPREESFSVGRFTNNKRELAELDSEVLSSDGIEASKVEEANGLVECEPLIDANTREIQFEKEEIEEAIKREVSGLELEKRKEICGENLSIDSVSKDGEMSAENQHLRVQGVGTDVGENQHLVGGQEVGTDVEVADDEITRLSVRTREGDHIDFSLKDDKCINDDVSSDAESDEEEGSSSPDATMAEIIPMLNELHLLLDSKDLDFCGLSDDGSDDAASEHSHKSENEYEVSDEDSESEGHVADKDDADVEEEETHEGKDDESKSAIKWTEDDEKNLMDLGTSELERNQRLENLIARRRARNNLRMMAEKNLIDFSAVDLPFNVPPITATRNNPFDLPDNSYDNLGFPPIPGSAPSILLPRRNPFDLPYESNEEKPDLKGDSFHQEFFTFPQKDALFRRHESFSVGHSSLGPSKLGQQENNWKLHFMPEKLDLEAVYPLYQTQQKVVDDLNLGAIPDIESISDVTESDIKFVEQKDDLEMEPTASPDHSSDEDDFGKGTHEDINAVDVKNVDERDLHDDVVTIMQRDVENNDEMESSLSKLEAAEIVLGRSADESQLERKSLEKNYSSNSSSSSSTETDERTFDEHGEKELATLQLRDSQAEESSPLVEVSCEESVIQLSREIIDVNPHKEPVYDSSPSAVTPEKFHSFSSTSSESQVEISNMCESPVSDKMESYVAAESGIHNGSIQNDSSNSGDLCSPSSEIHVMDKNGQDSLEVLRVSDDKNELLEPEFDSQHVSANSSASSLESGSLDGAIMPREQITCIEEGSPMVEIPQDFPLEENQAEGFSLEEEGVVQYGMAVLDSKVISTDSSHEHLSAEDKYLKPDSKDGPLEQGTTPDCLSFSNGSTSSSSESPEYELAANWPTSKKGTLDEIESEEQRHVSEQLDFLAEEYKSQFTEKRINVETDEKEIDEDLLSNVDVHEIAEIKNVGNSSHVEFITQESEGESIDFDSVPKESVQTDTNLEVVPVLEARSMEHSDLDFKQIEGGSIDSDSVPKESVQIETNFEVPPVLDARSMEHTDSDSKQLEGGSIDSDLVPKESVRTETNLEVPPIFEARSVEHTDLDSRQLEGGSIDSGSVPKESVQTETNIELPPVQTEINMEIPPVFEARSMEPTDLESRQLEGGSIDSDSVPKESIQSETNLELPPVLESKSMECTNLELTLLDNGIDDNESISPSKVEPLAEEETKKQSNLSSDLEILEVQTPEVSLVDPKEKYEETADQLTKFSDIKD